MIRLVDGTPKVVKQTASCIIWSADETYKCLENELGVATGEIADMLARMRDFVLSHMDSTYYYNKDSTSYEDILLINTDVTVLYSTKGQDSDYLVYEEVNLKHLVTVHCLALWGTSVTAIDTTDGQYTFNVQKNPGLYRMYRCEACGRIMYNLRGQDKWAVSLGLSPLTVCTMCTNNAKNLKNVRI